MISLALMTASVASVVASGLQVLLSVALVLTGALLLHRRGRLADAGAQDLAPGRLHRLFGRWGILPVELRGLRREMRDDLRRIVREAEQDAAVDSFHQLGWLLGDEVHRVRRGEVRFNRGTVRLGSMRQGMRLASHLDRGERLRLQRVTVRGGLLCMDFCDTQRRQFRLRGRLRTVELRR